MPKSGLLAVWPQKNELGIRFGMPSSVFVVGQARAIEKPRVKKPFSPRYALGQSSQQPPLVASVQEPPPRWSVL